MAIISLSLRSGIFGPSTESFPTESTMRTDERKTAEVWDTGFKPDQTFHTKVCLELSRQQGLIRQRSRTHAELLFDSCTMQSSPEKKYMEAELSRRMLKKENAPAAAKK